MSHKAIFFFIILFGIILFGYFQFELFQKYFPINYLIKFIIGIVALLAIFFPHFINKWKEADNMEEVKEFLIDKYKKKNSK